MQTEDFRVTIPVATRTFQTGEQPLLLSWVPSVERNSPAALLWAAGAINSTAASEPLLYAAPAGQSEGKTARIIIGVVIVIGVAVLLACVAYCTGV